MEKTKFIFLAFLSFSFYAQSCKKDKVEKSVIGFWTGQYSPATGSEWSWLLKEDNTIRVYIGRDTATASPKMDGTYTVTSDSTINVGYRPAGGIPVSLNNCKINAGYNRIEGRDILGTEFYVER